MRFGKRNMDSERLYTLDKHIDNYQHQVQATRRWEKNTHEGRRKRAEVDAAVIEIQYLERQIRKLQEKAQGIKEWLEAEGYDEQGEPEWRPLRDFLPASSAGVGEGPSPGGSKETDPKGKGNAVEK